MNRTLPLKGTRSDRLGAQKGRDRLRGGGNVFNTPVDNGSVLSSPHAVSHLQCNLSTSQTCVDGT